MQILDENEWISLFKEHLEEILIKTVLANPYIPHRPFRNQVKFLVHPAEEIFYGGAAGGGKSDALLMRCIANGCIAICNRAGLSCIATQKNIHGLKHAKCDNEQMP